MTGKRTDISALRQLLAVRFPAATRVATAALSTGWTALDEQSGGLIRGALTEVICASPSCGGQLLLGQLLRQTRAHNLRVALIDALGAFDPCSWPADWLEHLVWARCQTSAESLQVADLFARDANFGLIILDLRHAAERDLRRIPATQWYRLQRAVEQSSAPFLIKTPVPCVPSAQLRMLNYIAAVPVSLCRSKKPPTLKEVLAELPLAAQTTDGQFTQRLRDIASGFDLDLSPALACQSFPQTLVAVRSGSFAAILPEIALQNFDQGKIQSIRGEELTSLNRPLALAWNPRTMRVRPNFSKLVDHLKTAFQL